ncbi:MAG: hypothetical protein GY760_21990 [Deltaproteobacteria bacterium]|nr:hypothetical protein [Deltaproteobacteria bacterium]
MKQFVMSYFFIAIVFLSNTSAEETIRIAVGEWPPYYSESLKHYGPALHVVTEAFALGYKSSIRFLSLGAFIIFNEGR